MSAAAAPRWRAVALAALLVAGTAAEAQISIGVGLPSVNIGINVPVYPQLVRVPGYPVYWAPQGQPNYFFHDGLYWVYRNDVWYRSSWYNGPWHGTEPYDVPVELLRVPVRYYRQPPLYFRSWRVDAPPRWGEHWGPAWQQHRAGWDRWDRRAAAEPGRLPTYQRDYRGEHYPHSPQQQEEIRRERDHDQDHGRPPNRGHQDRDRDRPGQGPGQDDSGGPRRGERR